MAEDVKDTSPRILINYCATLLTYCGLPVGTKIVDDREVLLTRRPGDSVAKEVKRGFVTIYCTREEAKKMVSAAIDKIYDIATQGQSEKGVLPMYPLPVNQILTRSDIDLVVNKGINGTNESITIGTGNAW